MASIAHACGVRGADGAYHLDGQRGDIHDGKALGGGFGQGRDQIAALNLGNLWRRLVLPTRIDTWSLTSLQPRLVKTGGRLVKHARSYWLLLAESHLTRRLFGAMLQRIWALPVPTG